MTKFYQFSSRLFGLTAHALIMTLSIAFAIYFPKISSIEAMIIVILGSLVISTCFITFHVDLAQSLHILFLLDQEYIAEDKKEYRLESESQGVSTYHSGLAIELQAVFF